MTAQICETCVHKHDRYYCSLNSTCDKYEKIQIVEKKSWEEFRNNGLLWWINMILHTFGWAICVVIEEDGSVSNAYPARVKFRGFAEKNNTDGYIKVSQYLKNNVGELVKEAND
jgi:hypothetical protein|nr:MAG TPA: hypothetical protein [Caudoviricetes sp.]